MKGSSMNTHMGNITIDKEVIAQYAGTVARNASVSSAWESP